VVDGEGVAGAALRLDPPDPARPLPRRFLVDEIATDLVLPAIRAAAAVLTAGEFVGRCRCQIDLVGMQHVLLVEAQGTQQIGGWVPTTTDLALTATEDEMLAATAVAASALARSAGLPFYDPIA
jgi:hypothetical protein